MKTFEEIWNIVSVIPSAVTIEECARLYETANSLIDNSMIVELGCACGRSTAILGYIAKQKNLKLITIDPFVTDFDKAKTKEEAISYFRKNMELLETKYELLVDYSQNVALKWWGHDFEVEEKIDLLFIDGDHCYRAVRLDSEMWIPFVKKGHYILYHDYDSSWVGVKKAVDERKELNDITYIQSIAVTTKF